MSFFEMPYDANQLFDLLKFATDKLKEEETKKVSQFISSYQQNNYAIEDKFNSSVVVAFPPTDADPADPAQGQAWYNTTSSQFKAYDGATVRVFTVT